MPATLNCCLSASDLTRFDGNGAHTYRWGNGSDRIAECRRQVFGSLLVRPSSPWLKGPFCRADWK